MKAKAFLFSLVAFVALISTFANEPKDPLGYNLHSGKDSKFYHKKSRIPESVKIISVYAGSIILNAVGDGLNDDGHKGWGHACNAASIGILLTSPFVIDYDKSKWGYYLTSYVALRIATFDYAYNATRGLPLSYIGTTSAWDKGLQKLKPPDGLAMGRLVSLTIGISIPIKEFDSRKKHRR